MFGLAMTSAIFRGAKVVRMLLQPAVLQLPCDGQIAGSQDLEQRGRVCSDQLRSGFWHAAQVRAGTSPEATLGNVAPSEM